MYSDKPIVTIITVAYNSEKTIEDTIKSILTQTYAHIEYIIVDGLSRDNTVLCGQKYQEDFTNKGYSLKIISEMDKGLYDAMNKGIAMAKGEIVGILNSDDFYTHDQVIEKVVIKMKEAQADCLYGDLQYVDEEDTGTIVRTWIAKKGDFRWGWNPPHPTTFISASAYKRFGNYKVDYAIASDYDLLYRVIHKGRVKVTYLEEFLVKMRRGGRSTSGLKNNILGNREIYTTLKENNQKFKLSIILMRLLVKVGQFI